MGETNGLVPTLQMRPLRPPHPTLSLLAHTGRSATDMSSDPPEVSLLFPVSTDCFPEAAGPRAWLCLTAAKAGRHPPSVLRSPLAALGFTVPGTASGFQARHFYFALKAFQVGVGQNTIPRGSTLMVSFIESFVL